MQRALTPTKARDQHLSPVRSTSCMQDSFRRPFPLQRSQDHRYRHKIRDRGVFVHTGACRVAWGFWVVWGFFSLFSFFFFVYFLPFSPRVNLAKLVVTPGDKAFKYLDTSQPNGIKTENFQANFPSRLRTAARSANERQTCQGGIL